MIPQTGQRRKTILGMSAIVILICCVPCLALWAIFRWPYDNFRDQERNAVPLFDAQNEAVLAEIPPPPGAIEIERSKGGIYPESILRHGRYLYVRYHLPDANPSNTVNYYRQSLLSKGWLVVPHSVDDDAGANFFHDSACITVDVLNSDKQYFTDYRLSIWHDFDKQSFSPARPNLPDVLTVQDAARKGAKGPMNLTDYYELGESYFLKCP